MSETDTQVYYCDCGAPLRLVFRISRDTLNRLEEDWICTKGEHTGCPR